MAARRTSPVGVVIKWIVLIVLVVVVGKWIKNFIAPEITDVTAMVIMDKSELERKLDITLTDNPNMVKKIYEWCDGKITVDGAEGIGIVYIDGNRKGLHIDNKKYGMYGLKIGDMMIEVDEKTTYMYDSSFIVMNDEGVGQSTAVHYYNEKNNDCLIVIYNDHSSRVVALTYFNDYRKVTERLEGV